MFLKDTIVSQGPIRTTFSSVKGDISVIKDLKACRTVKEFSNAPMGGYF